ncbi:MAG: hypothetical protein JKY86_06440 [Gammaproteobacteria bacterium]|nr:hypothetical protein [Gammaproteobacteria bacterium]
MMNWDAFGAAGEWAGSIAVIATLIYLARQLREQNKLAKFQAWDSIMDGFKDLTMEFATNPELNSIGRRGDLDPNSLTDDESRQFQFMRRTYWLGVQRAWRAYELGYLGKDEWHDLADEFAKSLETPGGILWRKHSVNDQMAAFWVAVDLEYSKGTGRVDYSMGRDENNNQ